MRSISFFIISFLALASFINCVQAQSFVHKQSSSYQYPTDPLVLSKLDKWQDKKFGIMIHWGIYAVPGIVESWTLCSEDWVGRDSTMSYNDHKKWYWSLSQIFNPIRFDPQQWASISEAAGMKYLVFTTKHHDGFCMYNTKETDYSIAKGPFRNHPKADVAKHVFAAYRDKGFLIGAYFSKPDWHSQDYWWDMYSTPNRNNNYDIRKYPWKWNKFKQFTHNQITELMTNYGTIDMLWLDGGWVRPLASVNEEVIAWGAPIPEWDQDIDMDKIAANSRKLQPGLLVIDRTVHGKYENYQTPEQRIPEKQLDYPWESCLTLGYAWGWVPNENYKSVHQVVATLAEIVAKGGSLLLGVGPDQLGQIPAEAESRLVAIGKWLGKNGEAIYNTRITAHYQSGNTWFTQSKDGKTRYAIHCLPEGKAIPNTIEWEDTPLSTGTKIKLLQTGQQVKWSQQGKIVKINIPQALSSNLPALAFSLSQ